MHTAAQIVEALGDTTAVATALELPLTTVSSWKTNGIPNWRQDGLIKLAKRKGLSLTKGDFPVRERRRPIVAECRA